MVTLWTFVNVTKKSHSSHYQNTVHGVLCVKKFCPISIGLMPILCRRLGEQLFTRVHNRS